MEMDGLVAVITGAGRGLGEAISERLFDEGAQVALWDKDYPLVEALSRRLDPTENAALGARVDVTREDDVDRAVAVTLDRFGRIDVLVNNAGVSQHRSLQEMTVEMFESVMRVNVTGTFICCRAVVPCMIQQQRGKIVNIASLAGRTGRPGVGVNYAAAKATVIGLTQTLARELGSTGICVNAIAPGPILTEQTCAYGPEPFASWNRGRAIPRDGTPEDVAHAVVYLASRRSDWVTGITLDVNGGILIR
jgi:NAD(P)-dependent dehydrogenase (short-subunit alcohol dehydrogenase family)